MSLGSNLLAVQESDGSLLYKRIDGPNQLFTNQSLNALLLDAKTSSQNGKMAVVAGFEPNVFVYGTATSFSLDIYTSPDGINWVKIATITEATAVKSLGRNSLQFPAYAIVVDLTAASGGNVSVQCYSERRK